ncbi:MAG TPA: AAC(3) family N-acetyltransferase [Rhodospirillales bacterium]|nr:AAC(3) family N-acetyltransferase [Rhodospirillales bacterium]
MTVNRSDITDAFRQCGVGPGDMLMLHSDALVLAQLPQMSDQERYQALFDSLADVLGPEGTLVVPAFTYSFCSDETFDPRQSPSTVGVLTEYFRRLPGVVRTPDPLFSVAVRGPLANDFAAASPLDCFSENSIFGMLARHDAHIACLGCGFDRITFVHYVEQSAGVDYRYHKTFSGRIVDDDGPRQMSVRYLVRDLDRDAVTDTTRLKKRLADQGLLQEAPVGRVGLSIVRAQAFYRHGRALLDEDPAALIREGRQTGNGA